MRRARRIFHHTVCILGRRFTFSAGLSRLKRIGHAPGFQVAMLQHSGGMSEQKVRFFHFHRAAATSTRPCHEQVLLRLAMHSADNAFMLQTSTNNHRFPHHRVDFLVAEADSTDHRFNAVLRSLLHPTFQIHSTPPKTIAQQMPWPECTLGCLDLVASLHRLAYLRAPWHDCRVPTDATT